MRLISSIIFAIMAVVLPVAGVQKHFCTLSMAFVNGADDCPVEKKECCGDTEKHKSAEPDCMIAVKLLPNAEKFASVPLPCMPAEWILLSIETAPEVSEKLFLGVSLETMRGPPDTLRLFLVQQRLLI